MAQPRKVLLVYPEFPLTYWGFQYALAIFGKRAMHPPLSLITVAALCPREWQYTLVDLNVATLSDAQIRWADTVFVTGMGIQQRSMLEVLDRCRALGRQTVLGGPFATGNAERLAGRADCLVLGEAELTIGTFVSDLESGKLQPVYPARERPALTTSPVPRYDLLDLSAYGCIDVQFSRGCPFNCEFCDIVTIYGRLPRTKAPAQIVAEFDALHALGYRGPVFLVDDNFVGNMRAVRELLEHLIPWMQAHKYPFFLTTEATLNVANDEKVLANMRLSGFKRIFVGVETPSLESLKQTNKCHNTKKDMTQCVHDIVSQGMEVSGGFIVGFDSDQPDIFDRQITFIREAAIPWAMVGTLAAIPNTALWKRLEQEGRLLGYVDGDQFGRPNFRPRMDPEVLYQGYLKILAAIYDPEAYYSRVLATLDRVHRANLPNLHESNYPLSKVAYLLVRALFLLGVVAPYRRSFWRFLRAVVRRFPRLFVPALANAIIGHHFIRYTQEVLTRQRALLPHSLDGEPAAVSDVPVSK